LVAKRISDRFGDAAKAGALYLGINDARETVTGVQGQLEVRIEAL